MTIQENNATQTDTPPYEVLDENNNVVAYFMTKEECQEYINNNQ
tara:strand:+ start:596 stop:727 length:132 start_codon:yes stop_codon:yes gene_type:complete